LEQVLVSRDEYSVFVLCECQKVIVAGIAGAVATDPRLFDHHGRRGEEVDVCLSIVGADVSTELRVAQRTAELLEKVVGGDELEVAGEPSGEKLCRSAGGGEKCRDQDVWIENCSHSAAAACRVLCFDCELGRLLFAEVVALPKAVEQVQAKVTSERIFDDLAVSLAGTGAADLHGAEDFLVHG
jgi:hypothetical protein